MTYRSVLATGIPVAESVIVRYLNTADLFDRAARAGRREGKRGAAECEEAARRCRVAYYAAVAGNLAIMRLAARADDN